MFKTYYKAIAFLRKNVRGDRPVSVRRVKLKNLDGLCVLKDDRFVISISKELTPEHAIDVLLHEYAHTVSWKREDDDHGPLWGVAYSNIYRLFLEKFINERKS